MTGPRRLLLSLCSVFLGVALFGILFTIPAALRDGIRSAVSADYLGILLFYFFVALPGWVLAMPFVLCFENAGGRRAWIMLAIGTAIGPAFLGTWALLASHGHLRWQSDGATLMMSAWIAFLTTASYVVLLSRLGKRLPKQNPHFCSLELSQPPATGAAPQREP